MDKFFAALGATKVKRIRLAVMDMWKAFRNSVNQHAPQAKIIFDKFHIMRHLSEAMDQVRRTEYQRVTGKERRFIKGQRYTLLSHWENLTLEGRQSIKKLLSVNKKINTAYALKEQFGQLWNYRNEKWARKFFENWKQQLKWQRLNPFEKFAELIEKHLDGSVSYCHPDNKVKLGFVEGLNNKIRVIQRRAYGYRDEEYLRLKILTAFLRILPTLEPSFTFWQHPGEGYPFDNLQESYLPANQPILIVHTTVDGLWNLVLTPNAIGWLPKRDLSVVDGKFIAGWHTKHFVAVIQDQALIKDDQKSPLFYARIGSIYPLIKTTSSGYKILIAKKSENIAVIKTVILDKKLAVIMPLLPTAKNIALLANSMMGDPYGWIGLYGYRDCSSTTMDLFTPFGIWLPRDSIMQAQAGKFISLKNMSMGKKLSLIQQKSIPFLTLLWLPGHVMLYIGKSDGQIYVYHSAWGIKTRNILGEEGRLIFGRTIISPITLGKGYINIPNDLLDKVKGMINLGQ